MTRFGAALVALVCLLASSCQVQSRIEVSADLDGSGTVTVEVGLDRAALERLGDPDEALALDDLDDAGWAVSGPLSREGSTWWTASKGFADPADLEATLAEVAGPDVVVRGMALSEVDVEGGTDHVLSGTVDVEDGMESLAEPALTETLGGDPFGGYLAALEAEEGRPVDEMVSLEVVTVVDDQQRAVTVRPGDGPVELRAVRFVEDPFPLWIWPAVGGAVVVLGLLGGVALRRRRAGRVAPRP